MKPQPARKASTNSAATIFSALAARLGFSGAAVKSGSSGSATVSTAPGTVEGVPMTRRGPSGSSGVSLMSRLRFGLDVAAPLGGQPQGDEDEEAQAAEPAHQALGHRPGTAQRESARVG